MDFIVILQPYERSNFSVSQSVFKDNNPSQIVIIIKSISSSEPTQKSKLSTGALVGMIVAVSFLLLMYISQTRWYCL